MKDYLNQKDKQDLLCMYHLCLRLEEAIENKNTFTKEEITNFKKAHTFCLKGSKAVLERQNKTQARNINNLINETKLFLDYSTKVDQFSKRIGTKLDEDFEVNKPYYELIENIMHYNCRNCFRKCGECDFYEVFENREIPEMTGQAKKDNCKYAYDVDDFGKLE